jgi:hypothetical protein
MSAIYRIRLLTALILPAALAGCGRVRPPEGPVTEPLPGGGVRVTHREIGGRVLALEVVADWRVWEEGAPWLFGDIASVAGGAEDFYLLDGVNHKVVALTPEGELVRSWGREGSGPGELRYPLELAWERDRLWISDVGNRRFDLFTAGGDLVEERRWPGAARLVSAFRVRPDGRILQAAQWPLTVAEAALEPSRWYLLVHDLDESSGARPGHGLVDTLAVMSVSGFHALTVESEEGEKHGWWGAPVFDGDLLWDARGDRSVTVTGREYRFEVRDGAGGIVTEVVAPTPDLTVSAAHRAWYFEHRFRDEIRVRGDFTPTAATRERIPFAQRLPAISAIGLDAQGRVWVRAQLPEPGRTRLDLFTRQGDYLGSIDEPGSPAAFTDRGDVLLREAGEEGLDRFRVVRLR